VIALELKKSPETKAEKAKSDPLSGGTGPNKIIEFLINLWTTGD